VRRYTVGDSFPYISYDNRSVTLKYVIAHDMNYNSIKTQLFVYVSVKWIYIMCMYFECVCSNSERNYFLLVYDLWLCDLKLLVINADENSNIQS